MKAINLKSKNELAMQEIEELMRKHGITICVFSGALGVVFADGYKCSVQDIDMGHGYVDLPRACESDRLVIEE